MKILIVEDDIVIRTIEKAVLSELTPFIYEASNFEKAMEIINRQSIDLIVLDINLNGSKSGLELLEQIRKQNKNVYVIIISDTGKIKESYCRESDDYLAKPFKPDELKMKVIALRRRLKLNEEIIKYDERLAIDNKCQMILFDNNAVILAKKEYELCCFLIINKGILLNKDKIYEKIWGDLESESRKLDTLVSRLKGKLPYLKDKIISQSKFGYKLK